MSSFDSIKSWASEIKKFLNENYLIGIKTNATMIEQQCDEELDRRPTENWVVVVTVDDAPPEHPIITGVIGPFYSGEAAEHWASEQVKATPKNKRANFVVTPIENPYPPLGKV